MRLGLAIAAVLMAPATAQAQDISRVTRGPIAASEAYTEMKLASADGRRAVFQSEEDLLGEGRPGAAVLAAVRGVGRRVADRVQQQRALDGRQDVFTAPAPAVIQPQLGGAQQQEDGAAETSPAVRLRLRARPRALRLVRGVTGSYAPVAACRSRSSDPPSCG
jgi:hypothetical protein